MENLRSLLDEEFTRLEHNLSSDYVCGELVFTEYCIGNADLVVGREVELKELIGYVFAASQKLYSKIFIIGEKGVGKSTVASVLVDILMGKVQYTVCLFNGDYDISRDNIVIEIIKYICGRIINKTHVVEERDYKEAKQVEISKYGKILELGDEIKTIDELRKECAKLNIKIEPEKKVLEYFLEKLGADKDKFFVIFDDFNKFYEKENIKGFIENDLADLNKIFVCESRFTGEIRKHSELLKDAALLELEPLTSLQCKELLRRRILMSKNKDIDGKPDYTKDLLPFSEKAVELIAHHTLGFPLYFIRKSKGVYKKAYEIREKNATFYINEELAIEILHKQKEAEGDLNPSFEIKSNLTEKEKEIFDLILNEIDGGTVKKLTSIRGKSNVSTYLLLEKMVKKGVLLKTRKGKESMYSINRSLRSSNKKELQV